MWTPDPDIRFGNPEEWVAFGGRHTRFLERFGRLKQALKNAFIRTIEKPDKREIVLFFTGREAAEDFLEILLLCGNSESYAAQKLLRSMFERVVLLKYLSAHPEELENYFDFYWVTTYRQMNAIERFSGKGTLDPQRVTEVQENYERVRERFKTRSCKKCGNKEFGASWSAVPVPDMAQAVGLGKFVPFAYYEPLLHAHANIKGLLNRLEEGGKAEGITFGDRISRDKSDDVLCTAHALLLFVFGVQIEHLKLPKESFESLEDDYQYVWQPKQNS